MTDQTTYNHDPEKHKLNETSIGILTAVALRHFFAPTIAARNVMEDIFYDQETKKVKCSLYKIEAIEIPMEYFKAVSKVEIEFVLIEPPERIENDL